MGWEGVILNSFILKLDISEHLFSFVDDAASKDYLRDDAGISDSSRTFLSGETLTLSVLFSIITPGLGQRRVPVSVRITGYFPGITAA